jgi:TM2 domain-containing membrane protein YozV
MQIGKFLIFCCLFLLQEFSFGNNLRSKITFFPTRPIEAGDTVCFSELTFILGKDNRPSPLFHIFHSRRKKNKKITAAILAFPLPFGIVGLHRIYLGSAPYVPVVYIASLGGAFGILPLIDFCAILLDKDTEAFVNNKKVFMWIN